MVIVVDSPGFKLHLWGGSTLARRLYRREMTLRREDRKILKPAYDFVYPNLRISLLITAR